MTSSSGKRTERRTNNMRVPRPSSAWAGSLAGGDAADTIVFVPLCEHFASHPSRKEREKDRAPSALPVPAKSKTKALGHMPLRPSTARVMLCSYGQGGDGTGFLSFPLSWVQPKRNDVRLATELPCLISLAAGARLLGKRRRDHGSEGSRAGANRRVVCSRATATGTMNQPSSGMMWATIKSISSGPYGTRPPCVRRWQLTWQRPLRSVVVPLTWMHQRRCPASTMKS